MATGIISRFEAVVPIDNPSGHEETLRRYIAETLETLGLSDQTVDSAGNLFVRVPGRPDGEAVMLSAHMDSVPPCEGIRPVADTRNGRPVIRSEGRTILGADDKSGIAVILELMAELSATGFQENCPLELLFSTEEEIGLNGAKGFDMDLSRALHCYVLDGEGRVGLVFNAGPSQENISITCRGRASHAGIAPEAGVSAIETIGWMCADLPNARIDEELTTNLGVVDGGKTLNVVAPELELKGEARSHNDNKLAGLLDTYRQAARNAEEKFPGAAVEIVTTRRYDRFRVDERHPCIQAVEAVCDELGISFATAPMNIGSDAHILNKNGLPTVVLGMGFHYSHSLGEFIYTEELEQVYQITKKLVTTT